MPWESPARAAPDCWSSPGAAPIPSVCTWAEPVNSASKVRSWRAKAVARPPCWKVAMAITMPFAAAEAGSTAGRARNHLGHSACRSNPTPHVTHQAVVQAIQELKQSTPSIPRPSLVVIRGDQHIMDERHAVRDPETIMGGQYSLPLLPSP